MKAVVKFNFEDGAMYYSGTQQFVAKLGDMERYCDEMMTWEENIENAHVYSTKESAEQDAAFWREVFTCDIDVIVLQD